MKWVLMIAGISTCCFTAAVFADGLGNAKKSGCLSCHAVDRKIFGPSFQEVSKKYKGVAGIEAKLFEKVKRGGSGVWGDKRMPANLGKMTDEEYKTTVSWILSLK